LTVLVVAARALAMFLPPSVPLLLNEQQLPIVATRTEPAVPLVSGTKETDQLLHREEINVEQCLDGDRDLRVLEGTTCRNF
jgi:hypothetical protein